VLAEDEIDRTLNVTSSINLVSNLSEKSVLVSVKTNTVVTLLVAVSRQSNCLRAFAIGVLDVDVVKFGLGCIVLNRSCGLVIGSTAQET